MSKQSNEAARPSEPSAPRKMIDVDGNEHDEDAQCKYSGCEPAPQTSAEPTTDPYRNFAPDPDFLEGSKVAAPQPVSGDAPGDVTSENIFKHGARTGGYPCLVCHTTHDTNSGCPAPSPTPSVSTPQLPMMITPGGDIHEYCPDCRGVCKQVRPAPSVAGTQPTPQMGRWIEFLKKCHERATLENTTLTFAADVFDGLIKELSGAAQGTPQVEEIASQLLDAMETCHICHSYLILQEFPVQL